VKAVLRRAKRTHLCSNDVPTLAELVECTDDDLFEKIFSNPHHVLYNILPDVTVPFYGLRTRCHNRELVDKTSCLVQSSFLARMLYKDMY